LSRLPHSSLADPIPVTRGIRCSPERVAERRDMSIKRAEIREILGNKTMREITLK
jgi:hypothetical protein